MAKEWNTVQERVNDPRSADHSWRDVRQLMTQLPILTFSEISILLPFTNIRMFPTSGGSTFKL